MNSPVDDLIRQAIEAGKSGDKESAKKLLSQVVRQDPKNARAWYLLSQVIDEEVQRIYCLEKASELDPENLRVVQRFERIKKDTSLPQSQPIPPPQPAKKPPPDQKKKTTWILIGIVSIILICVLCVSASVVADNLGLLESTLR